MIAGYLIGVVYIRWDDPLNTPVSEVDAYHRQCAYNEELLDRSITDIVLLQPIAMTEAHKFTCCLCHEPLTVQNKKFHFEGHLAWQEKNTSP